MNPFWYGVIAGFFIGAFVVVFLLAARGGGEQDGGTGFQSAPGHNGDSDSMAVAVVFWLLYILCIWWCWTFFAGEEEPADRPAFTTAAAEQEHRRLLKKHGLEGDVALVCRDVLGEYYIRHGRRYKFQ